jgi:hypothetical protein
MDTQGSEANQSSEDSKQREKTNTIRIRIIGLEEGQSRQEQRATF